MPDGIYLVNCTRASDGDRISAVAFYQNLELEATTPGQFFGGNTGQPDAFRYIGDHGSFVTWEGPGNPRSKRSPLPLQVPMIKTLLRIHE